MNELDMRIALQAFLVAHLPGLTMDNTLAGWANRVPAPAPGDDYCLMAVLSQPRTSTNVTSWSPDDRALTITKPVQIALQVDFRGEQAQIWAEALSVLWPSPIAAEYLAPYGCAPLYANDPSNLTGATAEGQYEVRWTLDLFAAADSQFTVVLDYFEDVDLSVFPQA